MSGFGSVAAAIALVLILAFLIAYQRSEEKGWRRCVAGLLWGPGVILAVFVAGSLVKTLFVNVFVNVWDLIS